MNRNNVLKLVCFVLSFAPALVPPAHAQQATPQPPKPPQPYGRHDDRGEHPGGGASNMIGLPPGIWWNNPRIIAALTLTADQQKRMDEIFRQNRLQLIDMKAALEKEQINIEPLIDAPTLDQPKLLGEIAKIADLRAGLEKADAKMLIELRGVLTADQWTKLHAMQHGPDRDRHERDEREPKGRKNGPPTPPSPDDEQ
jgi:Spy/CpxP family protein refolding chaperone